MKGYKFFVKSDSSKEAITSWPARSKEDAIEYFARLKQMSVEQFTKIYSVEANDRS